MINSQCESSLDGSATLSLYHFLFDCFFFNHMSRWLDFGFFRETVNYPDLSSEVQLRDEPQIQLKEFFFKTFQVQFCELHRRHRTETETKTKTVRTRNNKQKVAVRSEGRMWTSLVKRTLKRQF